MGSLTASDTTLEERIRDASQKLDDGLLQTEFHLPDMHCAGCLNKVERGLQALNHIKSARANLSRHSVKVLWDGKIGTGFQLEKTLQDLGFSPILKDKTIEKDPFKERTRELILCLAVSGFAIANIMLLSVSIWSGASAETAKLFHLISGLIAIPASAFAGRPFFRSAIQALKARSLNMDVPISLAVILSLGMSLFETIAGHKEAYFDAAVMLLFFLLIGRTLDHLMREKANSAIHDLAKLTSKTATRIDQNGIAVSVTLDDIQQGDRLRIMAGERLPVNGTILHGESHIDRSLVTGESKNIKTQIGMALEAGVLNLSGPIDIIASSTSDTSFLADIKRMMEAAEKGRGHYVRIADRLAKIYAPLVHLLALVAFVGWLFITQGDWQTSLYIATSVLIITCPCALALAVPVAHVVAAGRLFQNGILMRDGSALERMAEIDTIIFDKTGTLTQGRPSVLKFYGSVSPDDHPVIMGLAERSHHPSAYALKNWAHRAHQANNTTPVELESVEEISGHGMQAIWQGKIVRLGKPDWVQDIASQPISDGNVAFAMEKHAALSFTLKDAIREDALSTINALKFSGLRIEMASGDKTEQVDNIATMLGIHIAKAGLSPQDKINLIEAKKTLGHKVLMVGDGLNDAPALAAGHVSMAPANATDVGRSASDFVFTRPSLSYVAFAYRLAKHTNHIVKQNFGLAIAYNCMAIPLAMAGYITPLIAAIAMSASSLVVVANSMRLRFMPILKSEPPHTKQNVENTVIDINNAKQVTA
jgi:Cu2+-exporting ATPase